MRLDDVQIEGIIAWTNDPFIRGPHETEHIAKCLPDTVRALATEVLESRAEIANRRMCVNCGKYAPKGHDRAQPLPECVDKEGYSACTFNHTPQEAWQHWSQIAHDQRAEIADRDKALDAAIHALGEWARKAGALEAALNPFAAMPCGICENDDSAIGVERCSDDTPVYVTRHDHGWQTVTAGHFRTARAALGRDET